LNLAGENINRPLSDIIGFIGLTDPVPGVDVSDQIESARHLMQRPAAHQRIKPADRGEFLRSSDLPFTGIGVIGDETHLHAVAGAQAIIMDEQLDLCGRVRHAGRLRNHLDIHRLDSQVRPVRNSQPDRRVTQQIVLVDHVADLRVGRSLCPQLHLGLIDNLGQKAHSILECGWKELAQEGVVFIGISPSRGAHESDCPFVFDHQKMLSKGHLVRLGKAAGMAGHGGDKGITGSI